jgi:hypothetical protein
VIIREEGGDAAAVKAAIHYITACQRMKGCWVRFNVMTQRHEYLYMKSEVHEIFQECWRLYEHSTCGIADKSDGKGSGTNHASSAALEGRSPEPVKGNKAATNNQQAGQKADKRTGQKAGGDAGIDNDSEKVKDKGGKSASDFEVAMSAAAATKKLYLAVVSKANLVKENIENHPDWQTWAAGHWQGKLQEAINPVSSLAKDGFAREYLMMDIKEVKKKYCQKELLSNALQFANRFDGKLDALQKLTTKLMSMHAAAMQ